MDTHRESQQRLSSVTPDRIAGQRGWNGLGETSHQIRSAVAELAGRWQTASASVVLIYLIAIIAANLITATFGPAASIFNAFVLIGLDLTARDRLHEAWHGHRLGLKMAILIASGSVLSWLLNRNAGQIALSSFVAFGAASIADTLVYQVFYRHPWRLKVNVSNVVSAAVDSMIFPTLAFGGVLWAVTLGQFGAKVIGGFVWSLILKRK